MVSPTAGINTSSAGTSSQLPKAVADKTVSKEPLTEVLGLAPRPAILRHSTQAGGICMVPPRGWEFRQEKQVYK